MATPNQTDPETQDADAPAKGGRKRKLKVFGGNHRGTHRIVLACFSKKEFVDATRGHNDFCAETFNPEEVTQAMSEPGISFCRLNTLGPGAPWERR